MVYNYVRKPNQANSSDNDLRKTMFESKNGTKISTATSMYDIPFSTLCRRLKSGRKDKMLGRFGPIFSTE